MTNAITIFPTPDNLFQFAAKDFCKRVKTAVKEKGVFSVALSGGNTPKSFYSILANEYRDSIPWKYIRFFFSDERYVPVNHENNNYHMTFNYLFSKVPVLPENIYRIPTECSDPNESALEYENTLKKTFQNTMPQFDLIYLGLGEDSHTASLMPLSNLVKDILANKCNKLVSALYLSNTNSYRITLTTNVINNSSDVIFLVTGKNKAQAVREVLEGQNNPLLFPAQLIHSIRGKTFWFLDKNAAMK